MRAGRTQIRVALGVRFPLCRVLAKASRYPVTLGAFELAADNRRYVMREIVGRSRTNRIPPCTPKRFWKPFTEPASGTLERHSTGEG